MRKIGELGIGVVVMMMLVATAVYADAPQLLSSLDAQVDSWGNHSGTSTVLAAGDGAFAGERIWHTFLRFELPTLAAGESFASAQLLMYQTGYWSWTNGNDSTPAAFRVWLTDNSWDNNVTWTTQPVKFQLPVWPLVDEGDLLDTQIYSGANNNTWVSWNVMDAMTSGATINLAVDVNRDYTGGGGGAWYHSLEQGWGPRIEYTIIPEPATIGLLVMGGLALLRSRKKA